MMVKIAETGSAASLCSDAFREAEILEIKHNF